MYPASTMSRCGPALREEAHAAELRLSPAAGVMVQAVWLDAGAAAAGRLLLSIHHLVVDGVSWRILVPDLAAAWAALARGAEPALAPRGTSLRRWAHWLAEQALDVRRVEELSFWRAMLSAPSVSLVDGSLDPARDVVGTAGQLTLTLPASVTAPLLTRVSAAFHGGINEVLLTGLAVAIADWRRRHGRRERPRSWSTWRAMAGRRSLRHRPVAHGRMVHQPVLRYGWTSARWISRRRWRAGRRSGGRSS